MSTESPAAKPRPRRLLVGVLFTAALVTGLVAICAVWVNRQALNTDNWEETSAELLEDPEIQEVLGLYLVEQLFTKVDVQQEIAGALPDQLDALAGPAAGGLRQVAEQRAPTFVARPRVQQLWRAANRRAHLELLRIVNGGGSTLSTSDGDVVLDLRPVVDQLADTLGVESEVPADTGRLVVMHSDDLELAQDVADSIRSLAVVFTALTVALFALAVWLAVGWRRIALRRVGWSFFALGLLVLLARRIGGNQVVDALAAAESVEPAAQNAWDIATRLLYDLGVASVVYGLILVAAAWLAGPTRAAVAARRALAPPLRYEPVSVYAVVTGAFLLVLLWGPTPMTRRPIGILLLAVLIVLGVEALRRQTAREFPDAQPGETAARIRARLARRRGARAPAESATRFDELEKLEALHSRGVVTDEEFATQKVLILDGR